MMSNKRKKVSLVLGSGGARGLAHIGVIRELEQQDYHIASIAGCSMGALIGGVYAAGKLDEFEHWVVAITKLDMMALLDVTWGRNGFVKGEKIINTLIDLVGDRTIEELPIPYTAVAADIENEKEIWINSGKLFDAIRASISIPLVFTPVQYKSGYLVDGGILNPVPIAPTFHDKTDLTVAVNLNGPFDDTITEARIIPTAAPNGVKTNPLREKLNQFINQLQASVTNNDSKNSGVYDVAIQSFDAMQSTIARQKLAVYPPDITINIPRNACGSMEFDRATEMIALGRKKTREQLG